MNEYPKIWPNCRMASPDVLVSVGTGIFDKHKLELPKVFEDSWLSSLLNSYLSNINGEATWERFWKQYQESYPHIYYRLNFRLPSEMNYCTLDQYGRMDELLAAFDASLSENQPGDPLDHSEGELSSWNQNINDKITQIANILIAKLFYFEPDRKQEVNYRGREPSYRLSGKILCRLRRNSDPLKKLVEQISSFRAEEGSQPLGLNNGTVIRFGEELCAAFRDRSNRFSVSHTIETVDPNKMQIISISLTRASGLVPIHLLPISGFPCTFSGESPPLPAPQALSQLIRETLIK
ncbi:MAG: hypothetical protein M1813_002066 [Trichoglossum hirsutum]|nr:MAG: hypothetical protein M1813_002066 [Trichoglossum hirsutum]